MARPKTTFYTFYLLYIYITYVLGCTHVSKRMCTCLVREDVAWTLIYLKIYVLETVVSGPDNGVDPSFLSCGYTHILCVLKWCCTMKILLNLYFKLYDLLLEIILSFIKNYILLYVYNIYYYKYTLYLNRNDTVSLQFCYI